MNWGILENVVNTGSITADSSVGGIAGTNGGGDLHGNSHIGVINNAKNEAAITANGERTGGIVGTNGSNAIITNSVNTGEITGGSVSNVGGISGWNEGSIQNCTNDAVINISVGSNIGGIAGTNFTHAEILDSHNKQEVKGADP